MPFRSGYAVGSGGSADPVDGVGGVWSSALRAWTGAIYELSPSEISSMVARTIATRPVSQNPARPVITCKTKRLTKIFSASIDATTKITIEHLIFRTSGRTDIAGWSSSRHCTSPTSPPSGMTPCAISPPAGQSIAPGQNVFPHQVPHQLYVYGPNGELIPKEEAMAMEAV